MQFTCLGPRATCDVICIPVAFEVIPIYPVRRCTLIIASSSANHVLPLGSDFPVESVNPLFGFYAAVTRLSVDGSSPHGAAGWYAQYNLYYQTDTPHS